MGLHRDGHTLEMGASALLVGALICKKPATFLAAGPFNKSHLSFLKRAEIVTKLQAQAS